MTLAKINSMVESINTIIMQTFEFNGISIQISFAERAKHSVKWSVAEHFHPWFEFNYVSSGSVYTTVEGKEFLVTAGQSYIIPPGITHSHRHAPGCKDDGICIRFSLQSKEKSLIINTLSTPRAEAFDSGIEKIRFFGGVYSTEAEFAAWLMGIYEKFENSEILLQHGQNTFSSQVIIYLEEYCSQKIKTAEIAVALNTSYRTLSRKFKAETGMCISEKLTEIRLSNAKRLLRQTELKIYNIAEMCGFENEFYFSGIFKKNEGISPSAYRNSFRTI